MSVRANKAERPAPTLTDAGEAAAGVIRNPARAEGAREYALWIGGDHGSVLTISIDKRTKGFPPDFEQCQLLNDMIQGLARAARSVAYHARTDLSADTEFLMGPAEDIADAIMLLSQLSAAVCAEASA